jgi:hypothetical protein
LDDCKTPPAGLVVGDVYQGVVFVSAAGAGGAGAEEEVAGSNPGGGGQGSRGVDAAGYGVVVEGYEAWEAGIKKGAAALPAKYNAPPPV